MREKVNFKKNDLAGFSRRQSYYREESFIVEIEKI